MKTIKTILITCIVISTQLSLAQERERKNAIFAELGGNAQGFSINYERQLTKKKGLMLSIGFGVALVNEESHDYVFSGLVPETHLSLPVSLKYLFTIKKENYIETGIGYTWIDVDKNYESAERGTHNFIAQIGYRRYFGKQKNWMWKANFSPILAGVADSGVEFGFSPIIGVGFAMVF